MDGVSEFGVGLRKKNSIQSRFSSYAEVTEEAFRQETHWSHAVEALARSSKQTLTERDPNHLNGHWTETADFGP